MHIHDFPNEILEPILEAAAKLQIDDGPRYIYGIAQCSPAGRYVRGHVLEHMRHWDGTVNLRLVCWRWHEWTLSFALRRIRIHRTFGADRWIELPRRRETYYAYEYLREPLGIAFARDSNAFLVHTVKLVHDFPNVASHIRHLSFYGFYTVTANVHIFHTLSHCSRLTAATLPWTMLRHLHATDWRHLLVGRGEPLRSLGLLAVEPVAFQVNDDSGRFDYRPLLSELVDFSKLRRLEVSGNSKLMPICDDDLFAIARTATGLEEFLLTNHSTVTLDGVLALIRASQATLRLLEHSPRSQAGFWHPHPGRASPDVHICALLPAWPRLESVSLSVPAMCATLFANPSVRWEGALQVRALRLCACTSPVADSPLRTTRALRALLDQARALIAARAAATFPAALTVELFFGDIILEPHARAVHADFRPALTRSGGTWPAPDQGRMSRKGPFGSTGIYPAVAYYDHHFLELDEHTFLDGLERGFVEL